MRKKNMNLKKEIYFESSQFKWRAFPEQLEEEQGEHEDELDLLQLDEELELQLLLELGLEELLDEQLIELEDEWLEEELDECEHEEEDEIELEQLIKKI